MSEVTSGLRGLLANAGLYSAFQRLVGGNVHQRLVEQFMRPCPSDRVLDIGCGPADILQFLPDGATYVGIDVSEDYIAAATQRFGARGRFVHTPVGKAADLDLGGFDLASAIGVLHHLDDSEAIDLLRLAASALRPSGRLVTLDGCFVDGQSPIARWMLRADRGRFVRRAEEYQRLARQVFESVEGEVRTDLLRTPYTHLVLTCSSPREASRPDSMDAELQS